VVAGYPGTPSSELIETVAKLHAQGKAKGVHVEWSTNEKAALELLAGAAYAGARTLFTCKMVGLNVASDALMSLNYVGVQGGTVLFVTDDPGPISSQTEQDTRRFAAFAKLPVLDPSTPEEGFVMMKAAFELSERYHTPVIVRPTTRICHASTFFEVAEETTALPVPEQGFQRDPKWIIFPRRAYEAHGEINTRLAHIAQDFSCEAPFAQFNPSFEGGHVAEVCQDMHGNPAPVPKPALGIVASGVSAAYAREALRSITQRAQEQGVDLPSYRFWQVGTPYPFPEHAAHQFVRQLDKVLVLEELDYVLEDEMLKVAGREMPARLAAGSHPLEIRGKLTGSARDRGENTVDDITERIVRFLGVDLRESEIESKAEGTHNNAAKASAVEVLEPASATEAPAAEAPEPASVTEAHKLQASAQSPSALDALPARPPVLCAGCPHRGSFYAVKQALKHTPAVLCGDIGCYTLGNAQPLDAIDTCLCMGAGITMAQGFAVAEPHKKTLAFVGDSTFFASGMTGVANAVYNQHDITICVLDNATTAMTGNQPHPGTGITLMGSKSKPISIEAVLRALGLTCVLHANPLDSQESLAAVQQALDFEGPSAVLFESPCVQIIKPKPAASVDPEACTGCKKCITSIGCPALTFDVAALGPKSKTHGQALVDASLCTGCGLCTQMCPFDALHIPAPVAHADVQ
jgi:indolepyruvate ferredoxin oxidoreductase alpha subunit